MSGNKNSGGHNAIAIEWNGRDFRSFRALDDYMGRTHGYSRTYWSNNRKLDGFKIKAIDNERSRTDADMIAFYSFVNARRSLLPSLGLKGMLELFNENKL